MDKLKEEKWFADDRGIIPEYIKKMSKKELDEYISEREIAMFGKRITED